MKKISESIHQLWTVWAADCAEHVLFHFEEVYPDDDPSKPPGLMYGVNWE